MSFTSANLKRRIPFIVAGLLLAIGLSHSQQTPPRTEYYRDEAAFRAGIKLFPFEIHEGDYLKVFYDDRGFVQLMSWHTREDSLIKTRSYEYWEDDLSIKRLLELTPDSLIIREVLFGDEPKSREFIEHVYGVEFVPDFRNRFTEVRVDSAQRTASYKIMSTQGELIGAVFLDYDSLGFLTNETWFQGEDIKRVREFRYIFHRDTGEQEVIERGREGQVVSHVRIKTDPHRRPGYGLGVEMEQLLDTTAALPQGAAPDTSDAP
ncbi:MAG: hypothetical protein ACETWG_10575 [Candidatus Neomarinimicrobiota bacterium]